MGGGIHSHGGSPLSLSSASSGLKEEKLLKRRGAKKRASKCSMGLLAFLLTFWLHNGESFYAGDIMAKLLLKYSVPYKIVLRHIWLILLRAFLL